MRTIVYSLCFLTFLIITITHVAAAPPPTLPPPLTPPPPPSIAYAILALQWPKGLCKASTCTKVPPSAQFTIHGVWPMDANGKQMHFCGPPPYNNRPLQSMLNDLTTFWPSFKYQTDDKFWGHEWTKHGSCSGLGIADYFARCIHLAKQSCSKLLIDLGNQGVHPSTTQAYKIADYEKGIYKLQLQSIYLLQCMKRASTYLVEVRLRVDSSLKNFIACPMTPPANQSQSYGQSAVLYT